MSANTLLAQEQSSPLVEDGVAIRITERPQVLVTVWPEESIATGVYEQSQIVVTLRIASKFPFDALSIDFPPIAGVEQFELAPPRTRKITSYAGEGYVHERSLALFALTPGTLRIPAVTVEGLLAKGQKRQTAFNEEFAGFTISVKPKPATYLDDWWMVSSNVDLQEFWSIPLEELREGDIVTRSISLRVAGVDAQRLPELTHGRTQGIAVRKLDSVRKTIKSSQGLTGIVTKSWSLKIEGANVLYISPVGVAFWDPLDQTKKKVAVAGHRIEPLAADNEEIANRLLNEAIEKQQTAYKLTTAVLLLLLIPIAVLFAHGVATVYFISRDRRFSHLFMTAGTKLKAYQAWFEWSLPEQCQSSEQWQSLNRQIQYSVFSQVGRSSTQTQLDRRDTVRRALRCARRHRLKLLQQNYSLVLEAIFGHRNRL